MTIYNAWSMRYDYLGDMCTSKVYNLGTDQKSVWVGGRLDDLGFPTKYEQRSLRKLDKSVYSILFY